MIATLAEHILSLPAWIALLVVFAVPALESSAFVGFIFPGEIALLLGGVMASQGREPLAAVLAAGIAGAALGDSVGYAVGKRHGRRLLDGTVGRFVKSGHLDRAEAYLAERGGKAVFFGRFTAALRVLIPGLAGMSGLRYRTFLAFNIAGAIGWGTLMVMLGYLGGSSWRHVEHIASRIGLAALAVVVLIVLGGALVRRTGPDKVTRLAASIAASAPVRHTRHRFPRTTGWVLQRLDPTRRTGLALSAAVVAAAATIWTFAGVTQDVVGHDELALLDPRIHVWVLAHRTSSLTGFFRVVTWLGATDVTVPALAVVGGILARRRRSWVPVLDIVAVYGTAVFAHAVVGPLVHRTRPPAADWAAPAGGWAYPSGHTTQAVAAWGILALLLAVRARPRQRVLLVAAAATLSLLVGASRIYLGVHWPTDVLGGALMSGAILAVWSVLRRPALTTPSSGASTSPSTSPSSSDRSTAPPGATTHNDLAARALVVIPTYNEADNVITVLERVRAAAPGVDVLVVDDSSPDGTAALVAAHPAHGARLPVDASGRVFLLSRQAKDGIGAAYRAGFGWALDRDYDAVVQMDADLSHPAHRVPALLEALRTADVAVGSRYVEGGAVTDWTLSRRLISRGGNLYVRVVLGLPVRDVTAGFKAFRRGALVRIGAVTSSSNGYCFQIETTWRAVRHGLTVTEVPITFTDRTAGTSKMSRAIVIEAIGRVLVWRWAELQDRSHRKVETGADRVAA